MPMTKPGPDPDATDIDLLRAIRNHYAPAVGTADIADEIGVSRQTADRRLRQLVEKNDIATDKVGQSRIWWLTTAGRRRLQEATDD
jgi:hypothetical protein